MRAKTLLHSRRAKPNHKQKYPPFNHLFPNLLHSTRAATVSFYLSRLRPSASPSVRRVRGLEGSTGTRLAFRSRGLGQHSRTASTRDIQTHLTTLFTRLLTLSTMEIRHYEDNTPHIWNRTLVLPILSPTVGPLNHRDAAVHAMSGAQCSTIQRSSGWCADQRKYTRQTQLTDGDQAVLHALVPALRSEGVGQHRGWHLERRLKAAGVRMSSQPTKYGITRGTKSREQLHAHLPTATRAT